MIKCCLNCQEDKSQFPGNCHTYCEQYLEESERHIEEKKKINKARKMDNLLSGRVDPRYAIRGRREINRERWQ